MIHINFHLRHLDLACALGLVLGAEASPSAQANSGHITATGVPGSNTIIIFTHPKPPGMSKHTCKLIIL